VAATVVSADTLYWFDLSGWMVSQIGLGGLIIGEWAKWARQYQGCTNSSRCDIVVQMYVCAKVVAQACMEFRTCDNPLTSLSWQPGR